MITEAGRLRLTGSWKSCLEGDGLSVAAEGRWDCTSVCAGSLCCTYQLKKGGHDLSDLESLGTPRCQLTVYATGFSLAAHAAQAILVWFDEAWLLAFT